MSHQATLLTFVFRQFHGPLLKLGTIISIDMCVYLIINGDNYEYEDRQVEQSH